MALGVQINITDTATPALRRILARLRNKRDLFQFMGAAMRNQVREHLLNVARTKHTTARALGAWPTGHWGKAAEKVSKPDALQTSGDAAVVIVNHPGITRAFRDIEIKPSGGKKFLTIPQVADTYGRRYYTALRMFGVPSVRTPGKTVLPPRADGRRWYSYVRRVHQKQDRTLLPSDAELLTAAQKGALSYVKLLTKTQQGGVA